MALVAILSSPLWGLAVVTRESALIGIAAFVMVPLGLLYVPRCERWIQALEGFVGLAAARTGCTVPDTRDRVFASGGPAWPTVFVTQWAFAILLVFPLVFILSVPASLQSAARWESSAAEQREWADGLSDSSMSAADISRWRDIFVEGEAHYLEQAEQARRSAVVELAVGLALVAAMGLVAYWRRQRRRVGSLIRQASSELEETILLDEAVTLALHTGQLKQCAVPVEQAHPADSGASQVD